MQIKIRVLILEKHTEVSGALAERLSSSPRIEVVGVAQSFKAGAGLAATHRPDVILLDARILKDEDAPALPAQAFAALGASETSIVVLTTYMDDLQRELLLQAGARLYQLKDIASADLIDEIVSIAPNPQSYPAPGG